LRFPPQRGARLRSPIDKGRLALLYAPEAGRTFRQAARQERRRTGIREDFMRRLFFAALALGGLAMGQAFAADYKIIAPAAPGGGWDQTARSMQTALQDGGISGSVQVTNVPGAGGTIGLAQFVNQANGDPSQLIVGGYVMVGAILTNNSPVTLDQITPIARLTGEYEAIVVPANSAVKDLPALVQKLQTDPGSVSWAGGSAGGTDQITAGLIAKAVGVDPTKVNYVAFSGGGEALAAVLGGQVTVGISSYSEFAAQVAAGQLRVLGVSSDAQLPGVSAPTFKEQGVDVVIQNWRMVAAAPGISDEQKAAITADVEKMVNSEPWQKILSDKGWTNTYLAGDAFTQQLKKDTDATAAILKEIGLVQ
jgi:putative tricarboxylic transport membrane protein